MGGIRTLSGESNQSRSRCNIDDTAFDTLLQHRQNLIFAAIKHSTGIHAHDKLPIIRRVISEWGSHALETCNPGGIHGVIQLPKMLDNFGDSLFDLVRFGDIDL
jgi:hypothetical protein